MKVYMNVFYKKLKWLKEYVISHENHFDILNRDFVSEYVKEFKVNSELMPYGADKCPDLGRFLSKAYKDGYLKRGRVGLRCMEWGFPKWVYSYSFKIGILESDLI